MWMRRRRAVPVGVFDPAAGRWRDDVDEPATPVACDELTVTTFNIWFDDYHAEQRYLAMARLLANHQPDLLVFQEVTPAALDVFLAQPWIREQYRRAAVVGSGVGNYGMLLLSRLPLTGVTYTGLPTRLSRGFLRAHCVVNGSPLAICSIHLDSGKRSARLRARQLHRIFRALRRVDDAVVLGDFNMRDAENARITAPFVDVWPVLRPGEDGFTEDTDINLMRWDSKPKHRQVRFDRVLVKGERWRAAGIELLGTEPVSPASPRVFPSDHFGVWCRLVSGPGPGGRGRTPRLLDRWKGVRWARFRSSP
jgi:tyrosyl-DNA phosphodiesterase 2